MGPRTPWPSALSAAGLCHQCTLRLLVQKTRPITTTAASRAASSSAQSPRSHTPPKSLRNVSGQHAEDMAAAPPRWARTPEAMKAPHRLNPRNRNEEFECNEDPAKLEAALSNMLGVNVKGTPGAADAEGDVLEESVRWLVVTHKSFDQGRRGFNDRLALLGRRYVDLQASLALISQPAPNLPAAATTSADSRPPAPAADLPPSLAHLTPSLHAQTLDRHRLARLAESYGLNRVIRWKPRQVRNLKSSGVEVVLAQAVYAVVGAVALRRGADAANWVVRERVLKPLGVLAE